jgi:hypothetical protein
MSTLIHRSFWFFVGAVLFILAAGLYLGNPTVALADGSTNSSGSTAVNVTLSILPGPLTATMNSISIVGETTNGAYTTTTYELHMSVVDATGSGSGWNLALADALPSSTTTTLLTQVGSTCATSSSCTLPQNGVTYPVMMQGDNSAPASIFNAGANTGMGASDITATLVMTVPTNANASSSANALTLLVSSGTI